MQYTFQFYCQDIIITNCVLTCLKFKGSSGSKKNAFYNKGDFFQCKNSQIQMDSEFFADPVPMPITDALPRINLGLAFCFHFCLPMTGFYD